MPTNTYTYDGFSLPILDAASGYTIFDPNGYAALYLYNYDGLIDFSGITSFVSEFQIFLYGEDSVEFIGSILGDNLVAGYYDDLIESGRGNDTIDAASGQDTIYAGKGDDLIYVGQYGDGQVDVIFGGGGLDTVFLGYGSLEGLALGSGTGVEQLDGEYEFINGTLGDDNFDLSGIETYLQDFEFYLDYGDDHFIGSANVDSVEGAGGDDTIDGGRGNDLLRGGNGDDMIFGGRGNDQIWLDEGSDIVDAGRGDDTIYSGYSPESNMIFGGDGTDTYAFDGYQIESLVLDAGASIEILDLQYGLGGTSNDNLIDFSGVSEISSDYGIFIGLNSGVDTFIGSLENEEVSGGSQSDTLSGNAGQDTLYAGSGHDLLNGGADEDQLIGGHGRDTLNGGNGADYLDGGVGHDLINGNKGADTLNGGKGDDTLSGDNGNDVFVFDVYNSANEFGNDVVLDFNANDNEIINLNGVHDITSFTDLVDNHIQSVGSDTEIFSEYGTILLVGVDISEIGAGLDYSENDFTF